MSVKFFYKHNRIGEVIPFLIVLVSLLVSKLLIYIVDMLSCYVMLWTDSLGGLLVLESSGPVLFCVLQYVDAFLVLATS